jgi:hypothetical protein
LPLVNRRRRAASRAAAGPPTPARGRGFLSILYSIGSKPLQIWDKTVQNGHIKRLTDEDIQSSVLEIMGTNVRAALRTRRLVGLLAARDSATNP